jgi:hypothetical protein
VRRERGDGVRLMSYNLTLVSGVKGMDGYSPFVRGETGADADTDVEAAVSRSAVPGCAKIRRWGEVRVLTLECNCGNDSGGCVEGSVGVGN